MKITCHMITSVDGKLLPSFWTPKFDGKDDLNAVYEAIADTFDADGIILGRKTMSEFPGIEEREPEQGPRTPQTNSYEAPESRNCKIAVVFDETGKLHYQTNKLPSGEHIVAVLGSHVTRAYQKHLEDVGVSYVMRLPGNPEEETKDALRLIHKHFNSEHLLLEGGGKINGSFFKHGLVDDLSVIIYPGLDGKSGRPSIIECCEEAYEKPLEKNKLELQKCTAMKEGYVHLLYTVHRD